MESIIARSTVAESIVADSIFVNSFVRGSIACSVYCGKFSVAGSIVAESIDAKPVVAD